MLNLTEKLKTNLNNATTQVKWCGINVVKQNEYDSSKHLEHKRDKLAHGWTDVWQKIK